MPDRSFTLSPTPAFVIDGTAIFTPNTVAVVCAHVITRVLAGCNNKICALWSVVSGCDVITWINIVSGRWLRVSVSVRLSIGVSLGCFIGCLQAHMIRRSNISYCKRFARENQT